MKCLALHGRMQTGEVFKSRLANAKVLPFLQNEAGCGVGGGDGSICFPDAPFMVVGTTDNSDGAGAEEERRSWSDPATQTFDLTALDRLQATEGPFDVIVGFSQGAALALYLATRPGWTSHVALVIVAAPSNLESQCATWPKQPNPSCSVICLVGKSDQAVPPTVSRTFLTSLHPYLDQTRIHILEHAGNHIFPPFSPATRELVQQIVSDVYYTPKSEVEAIAQQEEYDALLAIYGEEALLPLLDERTGRKCAHFTITVDGSVLEFQFTRNYPRMALSASVISTPVGCMRVAQGAVQSTRQRLRGQPCVFDVVQAVTDAIAASPPDASRGAAMVATTPGNDDIPVDDPTSLMSEEELAQVALNEVTGKHFDWHDDTTLADAGHWNMVIGLVGKPSAGKSNFFNAVTRVAELEEGDRARKSAAVGAAPFTTIRPNFGEAQVSYRGHAIRVTIKDVAGLVPGAYQGRGKGNAFLNDLVDAAALIHVVDGSGSAEADGVIREDGTHDLAAPAKDAFWVLRELHLWISGNVLAKWPSAPKYTTASEAAASKGKSMQERIVKLFTGYHSTPSVVHKAARLAALDLERGNLWNRQDIHRLVAHFILVRFPVVIGLNKCDLLTSEEVTQVVDSIRASGQVSSPVVPLSCVAENILQAPKPISPRDLALAHRVTEMLGGKTGVEQAISVAVDARAPLLVTVVAGINSTSSGPPPLHLLFKRGSKVGDVFDMLSRKDILGGDFVRAEFWPSELSWADGKMPGRVISKEAELREANSNTTNSCVLRIISNRRGKWQ